MSVYAKDPAASVDYSFDWSAWLAAGEDITSTNCTVEPTTSGAPVLGTPIEAGAVRGVMVSGGMRGQRYRISCRIETSANRTGERSLSLLVMER